MFWLLWVFSDKNKSSNIKKNVKKKQKLCESFQHYKSSGKKLKSFSIVFKIQEICYYRVHFKNKRAFALRNQNFFNQSIIKKQIRKSGKESFQQFSQFNKFSVSPSISKTKELLVYKTYKVSKTCETLFGRRYFGHSFSRYKKIIRKKKLKRSKKLSKIVKTNDY